MENLTAPKLDKLLRIFEIGTSNPQNYHSKVKEKLNQLYTLLDKIQPIKDDDLKILYFSVEKGTIEDYGDYEELKNYGEVSNYEQFENNYKEDYPDDVYWYRLVTSRYMNYRVISINYKSIIYADIESENYNFENANLEELLDFLIYKVKEIIEMLKNNTYNDYISSALSYKNRFGVIKRSDYWNLYPDSKKILFSDISQEEIDYFIENASESVSERIKNMTSCKYFECVRLAYISNNYEVKGLSDKELYLKYADGRDEGLSQINLDSSEEFDEWYNHRDGFGGHPWEIMRGHSYYRVNLYISYDDKGYFLVLDGSRILRKKEIVKIYLVLKQNNIPIEIHNVELIKQALTGNDYIGIVPHSIIPISCSGHFNKFKPVEFINNIDEKMFEYILWEEIEKAYLK